MPDISLTNQWSAPITTTADTVVQAIGGPVRITAQTPPGVGIRLETHDAITIKSGVTFRALSPTNCAILAVEVL